MVVCPHAPGLQEPTHPLVQTGTEAGGRGEAALIPACNHMLCVFLGTTAALSTVGKSQKLLSAARRGVRAHCSCSPASLLSPGRRHTPWPPRVMALEPSNMHGPQDEEPSRDTVLSQLLLFLSFLLRFQSLISRKGGLEDGVLLTKSGSLIPNGFLYTFRCL